ncbi:M23 family metallopeptidase [Brevibacillus sp. AG]|uniref:M23 family metallopeptidase n=1 Tax=Brevibacillus sp. AG TaxID=3020891 RepID=UPI00232ED37E|nr:M23 family metallopeptidase [Brevibacillus sp. AG]MDC0764166.1 M23 family metallopeptidase [Brevibacillus sp. AG]
MPAPKLKGEGNYTSKITNKAVNTTKDIASQLIGLAGKRGGSFVKNFAKELAKQAVKVLFKIIGKMIWKGILWLVGTYGLIAFLAILVILIVSMSLYIMLDSDGDGIKDAKGEQHYQTYVELAKTSVDMNKPEQYFFRTNEHLLMIASNITAQKGVMSSNQSAQGILIAVKPTFKYSLVKEWDLQRTCYPDGRCSSPYKANERDVKVLTGATNFIGTWALEYEVKPVPVDELNINDPSLQMLENRKRDHSGTWNNVSCGAESCTEQMDQKAYLQTKYVTQPDLTILKNELVSQRYLKFDFSLLQTMYNQAVSESYDIYFRNLEDVEGYGDGISGGDRSGGVDRNVVQRPPNLDNTGDWIWPTPTITNITSYFGKRLRNGTFEGHQGIDIAPKGSSAAGHMVYAPRSGTVIKAGKSNGYGIAVFIRHADGMTTELGHLQYNGLLVKEGDRVNKGDPVATIGYGKVGDSSGPHLHVSIDLPHSWVRTNPSFYIRP